MDSTTPSLSRPIPGVFVIELRRPEAANRLQLEDLTALPTQLDSAESDPDARVLVLSAQGRVFCSGFDLRTLMKEPSDAEQVEGNPFEQFAERLANTRLITIAAINGAVVGGGTDLALACDLRIGTQATKMHMPAARFGLPLYEGALKRYVSRLGIDQAKRLIFLAEEILAPEMLDMGFLLQLVPSEELACRAMDIARQAAELPHAPAAAMKAVLNAAADGREIHSELRAALVKAFDPALIASRIAAIGPKQRSKTEVIGSTSC